MQSSPGYRPIHQAPRGSQRSTRAQRRLLPRCLLQGSVQRFWAGSDAARPEACRRIVPSASASRAARATLLRSLTPLIGSWASQASSFGLARRPATQRIVPARMGPVGGTQRSAARSGIASEPLERQIPEAVVPIITAASALSAPSHHGGAGRVQAKLKPAWAPSRRRSPQALPLIGTALAAQRFSRAPRSEPPPFLTGSSVGRPVCR